MVVRYDLEPALKSIVEAAKNGFDKRLVLEKATEGVSESKGEIERAVQTIESQSRTLRSALETSYRRKVPDDHPVLTYNTRKSKMGRHRTLDTVVVSGGCQYHSLGKPLNSSKQVPSLNRDDTKGFFLGPKTIPLRKSWEMHHQVFSPCKAVVERVQKTDMMSKLCCQSLGFPGIPRQPNSMRFCYLILSREINSPSCHQCKRRNPRSLWDVFISPNVIWTSMDIPLDVQRVMPQEVAREALEFNILQHAEKGWNVCSSPKRVTYDTCSPTHSKSRRWNYRSKARSVWRGHKYKEPLKSSRCLHALTSTQGISKAQCQKAPAGKTSGGESPENFEQETLSNQRQWILA